MTTQTNLINVKQSIKYPELFVHKYHRKVFFKNLWHEDSRLVESRGRVYNSSGDVVINPFTKIFNYKENNTNLDRNEKCLVIEKINGFMAGVTWVPDVNDVVVSTTGSLDSDYGEMAKEMMPKVIEYVRTRKEPITYIFEIVHPNDPHIIPENIGVYLIGMREVNNTTHYKTDKSKETRLDYIAKLMKAMRPVFYLSNFDEVLEEMKSCKHEGFMVYGESGKVLKLKSPYYLSSKALARKKDIMTLDKSRVDEEFYPLIDEIKDNDYFNNLSEQERLDFIRNYFN